jgi:hypothetical protein
VKEKPNDDAPFLGGRFLLTTSVRKMLNKAYFSLANITSLNAIAFTFYDYNGSCTVDDSKPVVSFPPARYQHNLITTDLKGRRHLSA